MSKGSPFGFFSALCDFSKNILMSQKGPPFEFFIFCNRIYVNKAQRVPPFTFFGTMRRFLKEKKIKNSNFFFKKSLLRFLSLRYSADFRRSRLVSILNTFPPSGISELFTSRFSAVLTSNPCQPV